jgi:hypothetical protein
VSIQYLVPCSCGRKTPAETRQAGESISCECGQTIVVPRLLELKKLEKAAVPEPTAHNPPSWGVGNGISLIGSVLFLVMLGLWFFVLLFVPGDPYEQVTPDQIREQFTKMSPYQTWQKWTYFEKSGLNPRKERIDRYFEGLFAQRKMILLFFGIGAALGAAILLAGILVIYKKRLAYAMTHSKLHGVK